MVEQPPIERSDYATEDEEKVKKILTQVSADFGVPLELLQGRRRTRKVAIPRHIAMYLISEATYLPFKEIGRRFGRDHSTVCNSLDRIASLRRSESELDQYLNSRLATYKPSGLRFKTQHRASIPAEADWTDEQVIRDWSAKVQKASELLKEKGQHPDLPLFAEATDQFFKTLPQLSSYEKAKLCSYWERLKKLRPKDSTHGISQNSTLYWLKEEFLDGVSRRRQEDVIKCFRFADSLLLITWEKPVNQ